MPVTVPVPPGDEQPVKSTTPTTSEASGHRITLRFGIDQI